MCRRRLYKARQTIAAGAVGWLEAQTPQRHNSDWPAGRYVPEHTGVSVETLVGLPLLVTRYQSSHTILSCLL